MAVSFIAYNDVTYSCNPTLTTGSISNNKRFNSVYAALGFSGSTLYHCVGSYLGYLICQKDDEYCILRFGWSYPSIHNYSTWYYIHAEPVIYEMDQTPLPVQIYLGTLIPRDIVECKKVYQYCVSDWTSVEAVDTDQMIQFLMSKKLTYNNVPIMAPATQINYSDGTYEVIRDVLTEQQAKDHAYVNLLNTYGSFYKANEVDISGAYRM